MLLKEKIKKFKGSSNQAYRLLYSILKPCWLIIKLVSDVRLRAEYLAKWRNSNKHYQISTFTQPNRYPLLFQQCTQYLQNISSPKILSFGCSTGEEVKTIGEYLPAATIIGVDINKWCIKQCRKNNQQPMHFFYHRFSKAFEESNRFDAIFCMAVFQRTENRMNAENSMATGFSFLQFEKEIDLMNDKLKAGGLLIIDHADFNFMDTAISVSYHPLEFELNQLLRKRPLFNSNNIKIADEHCSYRVFVKNAITPTDSLF